MITPTRNRLRRELAAARRENAELRAAHEAVCEMLTDHANEQYDELLAEKHHIERQLAAEKTYTANLRIQLDALTKDPTARALAERLAELTQASHAMDVRVGDVDIFQADGAA